MSGGGEKTEKPTPKKNKESRKEGQVPRTQELGAWASMLVVGMAMPALIGREMTALRALMYDAFTMPKGATTEQAFDLLARGGKLALLALGDTTCDKEPPVVKDRQALDIVAWRKICDDLATRAKADIQLPIGQ